MNRLRLNEALSLALELTGVIAYGYWGWATHSGDARYAWAIGTAVASAAIWDVFRVPGDSGPVTVAVPGWLRLVIEAVFFTGVAASLASLGHVELGLAYAALVAIHYLTTPERVLWLMREGDQTA